MEALNSEAMIINRVYPPLCTAARNSRDNADMRADLPAVSRGDCPASILKR
jgi:hypothetical protein